MEKQNGDGKKRSDFQVPNLERALQILEYLIQFPNGKGISDLSKELSFPKNSVFRILNTLEGYNYIQRDELKKYTLTNKMFAISYDRADRKNLIECSATAMRNLRDNVKETVVLSILSGHEGVVLEEVSGLHPFRFIVERGTKQEAHTSASVKSMLAFSSEKERESVLENVEFIKRTDRTILSKEAYLEELDKVKMAGFATDAGEALEGVCCISAPIFSEDGTPVAALTITGPSSRISSGEVESLGAVVKDAALDISRKLGSRK